MNSKSLYILFFSVLLCGCNTGPDFERVNESDPGAKNFKPNAPVSKDREITKEKLVILRWKDKTDYEDGYLVEKKTFANDEFKTVEILEPNATTYSDNSRLLTPHTSYKISSFVYSQSGDTTNISKNSSKIIDLDLGGLGQLDLTEEDSRIEIKWENRLEYFDALMIGYKDLTNGAEQITWTDTLAKSEHSIDSINNSRSTFIETPVNDFSYNVVVTANILNPDNELEAFSTHQKEIKVNEPVFENLTFTDEESLAMQWSSKVEDVDYYEIYDGVSFYPTYDEGSLVATVPGDLNSYTLNRVFNSQYGAAVGIKAVKNDDRSSIYRKAVPFQIKKLENFRLIPQENSIQLQWDIPSDPYQPYTRFIIERSVNNKENFQVYEELSPDTEEYTDANILRDENYYYRIKSASSGYSGTMGAGFLAGFTLQDQIQLNDNIHHLAISQDKQEIGVIEQSDPGTVLLLDQLGNKRQINEFNHRFFRVRFSRDNEYIILTGDSVRVTYTKIYDRNTLEMKFQFKRDNLSERILLLPNADQLLTTDYNSTNDLDSRRTTLKIIDINTKEVITSRKEIEGYLLWLMFDSDKNELITISRYSVHSYGRKQMIVFNAGNLNQIKKISPYEINYGNDYRYDDESDVLYITFDEELLEYDISTDVATKIFSTGTYGPSISKLVHLKVPNLYAFTTYDSDNIFLYDPSNDLITLSIKNQAEDLIGLYYSSDKNQLIIQNYSSGTLFYDLDLKWTLIK